jgi:hypothetical protein
MTTLVASIGEGIPEEGEVLDRDQDQAGIAMVMTMILEIAGERLDGAVAVDVVPAVLLRREEEEEDEEVHQPQEELSLFLLIMVCPFSPRSYSQLNA